MAKRDWLEQIQITLSTVVNTTTAGAIFATTLPLPGNFFNQSSASPIVDPLYLMVETDGIISLVSTTPGTLTLELRMDAVVVATTGAMTMNTAGKTNVPWYFRGKFVAGIVSSTTAQFTAGKGFFVSEAIVGAPAPASGGAPALFMATTSNTFDFTVQHTFQMVATWQTANASNSIAAQSARLSA